jgi:predicted AAA+ superfamily ATPase
MMGDIRMEINKIKYDDKNKSIIIAEGPQGVGKTGFAEY